MTTLIYILGEGRSGSTILESLINSSPDVLSVGEAYRFWERFYKADSRCACGSEIQRCPLWSRVAESLRSTRAEEVPEIRSAMKHALRFRNFGMLYDLGPGDQLYEVATDFYERVVAVSGKRVIVDSSKSVPWGLLVTRLPGFRIVFLEMVKPLASLANSWRKDVILPEYTDSVARMPRKSPYQVVRTATRNRMLIHRLKRTPHPYLAIPYGEFCSDFARWHRRIADFIDVPLNATNEGFYPRPSHGIAGNPVRQTTASSEFVSIANRDESLHRLRAPEVACLRVVDRVIKTIWSPWSEAPGKEM